MANPETHTFEDDGGIPNSRLPVLAYHSALERDAGPGAYEQLFAGHGWLGAWRDGIFPFHHFHSTAHEVLANIARVPIPDQDPVAGKSGPLVELWRGAG